MIEVKFKAGKDFLEKLSVKAIQNAAEILLIQDESGSGSEAQMLSLDYAIAKEATTKAGEGSEDIKEGVIYVADSPSAEGKSVSYPQGMPFLLLYHFRQREWQGAGKDGAECGTPMIEGMIEGKRVAVGSQGFKLGECAGCVHNTMDKDVKIEEKCLFMRKIIVLTVMPDPDNPKGFIPVPVQIKAAKSRAKESNISLTKYIKNCKGRVHRWLGKLTTKAKAGVSASGEDYTVHTFDFNTDTKLEVTQAQLDVRRKFRDTMMGYYIIQHQFRTDRNADMEAEAAAARLKGPAVAGHTQIGHKEDEVAGEGDEQIDL